MTAEEQRIEQAREEGQKEGFSEGLLQGLGAALLVRWSQRRFGAAVTAHIEVRITTASIEQIRRWTARKSSAATITELLADD
jgi:flagellar biosynthesis/type III secretory pathway protein FliH